jgi:NAD+ kinase
MPRIMARRFTHAAIVGKYQVRGIGPVLEELGHFLVGLGLEVSFERETALATGVTAFPAMPAHELGKQCDIAIVVGGDGTMLSVARQLAPYGVPLIGINQGRLGFLTDIAVSEMESVLEAMLAGAYTEETRPLLDATLTRAAGDAERALAFNDVVVNRGALGGMIDCAVTIDGRFVYAMRGDGLIIATPTGSTAYALSAQGPIVDPLVAAILLVPVAPHALTNRPIAVRDSVVIEITLLRGKDASLHCDGQANFPLAEGDRVVVRRAEHRVRLLHPKDHDHFAMLRRKLHWSETPERLRPQ